MRTTNFSTMNDNEKIMNIVEKVLGATSPKTSVSMEEIINKGIELGVAEDYPRGGHDGHPWWPRTSLMMGVGDVNAVMENEEPHLHRSKMYKKGARSKMYYWVDKTKNHEVVRRSAKASDPKGQSTPKVFTPSPIPTGMTDPIEKFKVYEMTSPGKMAMVQKVTTGEVVIITNDWITKNPDKYQTLYGGMTLSI